MKPHTKITHGDFNPTNVLIGEDGEVYPRLGARGHRQRFRRRGDDLSPVCAGGSEEADLYLKLFCKKNDIAMQYVQRWLPIVAAAQMTKSTARKRRS